MHKNAKKCNKTQSKWCINKHGASKIIDTFETYHGAEGSTGPASFLGECPSLPGPGGNASPLLVVATSPSVFQIFLLGHPPWLGGGLGPGEPFPGDRDTCRALAVSHRPPSLASRSFRWRDFARAAARPVARLAALIAVAGHPFGCTASQGIPCGSPPGVQCGDKT
jgi:hypothetical protein